MQGRLGLPLVAMLALAPLGAQTENPIRADFLTRGQSSFPRLWRPYQPADIPPPNFRNSPRLSRLIHDGKLELTLDDFLRLVVENDLALEADRYTYLIGQTDLLRARSGQAARGLPESPVPAGLFAGAIGAGVGNTANVNAGGTGWVAISAAARQVVVGPRGNFDPVFSVNTSFDRVVSPLNTVRVSGTPTVTVPSTVLQTRLQQELSFGASYSVSFNLQRQSSTQNFLLYNPAFTSFLSIAVYQPLLNGFGRALNRRFITAAETNRKVSRELFRQQLNDVASNAANLYWDLVALQEQVRVAEQSVAVAQKLYDDNVEQAAAGALAPLDVVQTESQLAARRVDLIAAQTNVQMQEARIQAAISKAIGRELDEARIEAADALPAVDQSAVPALGSALVAARKNRAVIHQGELQIENQKNALAFTRSNLRPTLSVFAQFNSYSLAAGTTPMFSQMVKWAYPEYAVGFSLNFSLLNRAAQADDLRARIELQQAEVSLEQTKSQVDLAVRTAQAGLIQYRAQVEAAQRAVTGSQVALRGEQQRLFNGISTPYRVILAERDLASAQSAEIQARVNWAKALVALQVSTGAFLESHDIPLETAMRGSLWRDSTQP
jgi:outer membrane protein